MILVLALALLLLGGFWVAKVRGPRLTLAAAALAVGAAGYTVAGKPGLAGDPRAEAQRPAPMPLTGAREVFFGKFNASDQWMTIAEGYASRGKTAEAAGLLGSAVREHPRNFELWTSYGNALVDHSETLTPAARLAFERAVALAPDHPGPRFFYALAKLRSGDPEGAREDWETLLAETPERAPWRPLIEGGLALTGSREPATSD